MKAVIVILVVLVIFTVGVSAGNLNRVTLYAGTGLSIPGGPKGFKDNWNNGFHFSGGIGYHLMPRLQVIGYIEYHSFPYDIDEYLDSGAFPNSSADEFDGRTYKALMIGLDTRIDLARPGGRAHPYARFGFGIANTDIEDLAYNGLTVRQGTGESRPYINFAGGVESALGMNLSLFFQGQVVLIFYNDENSRIANETVTFFPITIGLRF